MRFQCPAWLLIGLVLLLGVAGATGQGTFQNLNFEQATIVQDPSSPAYPYAVFAAEAIPGWTPTDYLGTNVILYNSISIGATSVSLCGLNSQGGTPPPLNGGIQQHPTSNPEPRTSNPELRRSRITHHASRILIAFARVRRWETVPPAA
jgi:hypothetical protein